MIRAIVVMGVSGSGKSTLARALASAFGWQFVEGDDLHPPANIAKMASGIPLDDEDRTPFLENVAQAIVEARATGVVVSCSALKRRYRDLIRARAGAVTFILPVLDAETLLSRLSGRRDHFMPPALLDSQLAALEPPQPDEDAILVTGRATVDEQVAEIQSILRAKA
jgi:gluconokinase